jgi:C4-dicarboxylate-specific signal transduction histidine kinase
MRRSDDSNPKKISISAKDEKGFWNIKIQDTGCGISKENMVNLFKPFFTTKEVGSGTGLGLVITLKIIKSFGGEIHVESQEGHGATFLLHLPKL